MTGTVSAARWASSAASAPELDDALRALLDHVAQELAAEYLRFLRQRGPRRKTVITEQGTDDESCHLRSV
jgi:hypothetical protein